MTTSTTTTATAKTAAYKMSAMWSAEFVARQKRMQAAFRALVADGCRRSVAVRTVAENSGLSVGWTRSILRDRAHYVFCSTCGTPMVRKTAECSRCSN